MVELWLGGKVDNYLKRAIFRGNGTFFWQEGTAMNQKGPLSGKGHFFSIGRALFKSKSNFEIMLDFDDNF